MHPRISINSNCFANAPAAELAPHLQALRPPAVSLVSTYLDDPPGVRALLDGSGCRLESIVHGFVIAGSLQDEAAVADGQQRLSRLIEVAAGLGAASVYVGTGGRGALTWEAAAERFATAVAPCLVQARAAGVALMAENTPQVYVDVSILTNLRDAVTLSEMSGVGVALDFFGCWMEAGLKETIARAVQNCDLVQVSDYVLGDRALPGRAVPGDGVMPLRQLIEWTLEAGYAGVLELELTGPRIAKEGHLAATRRGVAALEAILAELGA